MKWELVETAVDSADQTIQVLDPVVYTVGDRVARRLEFGVIEKIKRQGPFTHRYWPNGAGPNWEGAVEYEYYEYKFWIRHSKPKTEEEAYFRETGVSIIEGKKRVLALPEGMYEWALKDAYAALKT